MLFIIHGSRIEESLDIRLIQSDDITAANDFYNRSHGRNRSVNQWKWEFQADYLPFPETPYVIVENSGTVIGTQALLPIKMIDKNGIFWTAKSEETLLDPAFRGIQLFEKMYRLLFTYVEKNDIHSIWGFTSATKAFKRLEFQIPGKTSQLFFPFCGKAVYHLLSHVQNPGSSQYSSRIRMRSYKYCCALAGKISTIRNSVSGSGKYAEINGRKLEITTLENPPDAAGEICRRFIKKWGGITIYRDSQYLDWRLFKNPHIKSIFKGVYLDRVLVGWGAYAMDDSGMGYFVDLFLAIENDDDNMILEQAVLFLLKDGISNLRKMGAVGIRGWRVNNHPFDILITKIARRVGFYYIKRGHEVVCYIDPNSSHMESFSSFDNWFISRIYTEGISG